MMMDDQQIHWFSIINSLMIVLFLSGMVAMIMMRTLHRDISKYNQLETAEEAQEETGWKLVRPGGPYSYPSPPQLTPGARQAPRAGPHSRPGGSLNTPPAGGAAPWSAAGAQLTRPQAARGAHGPRRASRSARCARAWPRT